MRTFTATGTRADNGWELTISKNGHQVGVTQARSLARAERQIRDWIALDLGLEDAEFTVRIVPALNATPLDESST
jgi:hypothetical protein